MQSVKNRGGAELINPQDFADIIRALPVRGEVDHEWHIYFDDTKPASLYGGTWEELAQGTFIMAAGSDGKATLIVDNHGNPNGMHTMTVDELAAHAHTEIGTFENTQGGTYWSALAKQSSAVVQFGGTYDEARYTGKSQAFDIRPPTIIAHYWRRVS